MKINNEQERFEAINALEQYEKFKREQYKEEAIKTARETVVKIKNYILKQGIFFTDGEDIYKINDAYSDGQLLVVKFDSIELGGTYFQFKQDAWWRLDCTFRNSKTPVREAFNEFLTYFGTVIIESELRNKYTKFFNLFNESLESLEEESVEHSEDTDEEDDDED